MRTRRKAALLVRLPQELLRKVEIFSRRRGMSPGQFAGAAIMRQVLETETHLFVRKLRRK